MIQSGSHTADHANYQEMVVDLESSAGMPELRMEYNPALENLDEASISKLRDHLRARLTLGREALGPRVMRYAKIDRMISTWQQLNKQDSQRELAEDHSGRQHAIPFNIPLLASYLSDMTSYFAEALAPIANPFSSTNGTPEYAALTRRLNEDALARDYYTEVVLTVRSLLKYNIGGMYVEWDFGGEEALGISGVNHPGNSWKSLDPYNTMYDPAVRNPRQVAYRAEWAAMTRIASRYELVRKATRGEWVGLDKILKQPRNTGHVASADYGLSLYFDPAQVVPGTHGLDAHTEGNGEAKQPTTEADWAAIGLGSTHIRDNERPFQLTTMYCWLLPAQFDLLDDVLTQEIEKMDKDPELFLQLWRFELIDGDIVVSARPVMGATPEAQVQIPFYLAYMTEDQLQMAQRSQLELMRGFQRFTSAMHNIYVEGMRGNVWGWRALDPQMFDSGALSTGETSGVLTSKQPGRDVRSGLMRVDSGSGVNEAMQGVEASMALKDRLFPSQALPSQISGMDRAVTSQVTSVVQGAQRELRMLLRLLDSALMMPTRMAAVRNVQDNDAEVGDMFKDITDEQVAKAIGSGIESMEAERISEHFWKLLMAIVQNQESSQMFNVPAILAYVGRLMNLSANMEEFVREQPQQPPQDQPTPGAEGVPPPPPEGAPV